jgi:hypothetical protein
MRSGRSGTKGDVDSIRYVQDAWKAPKGTKRPIIHLGESTSALVSNRDLRLSLSRVKKALRQFGLLPITDSKVPSLVSIVAGSPVSGSWWGHPAGPLIYQVAEALDSDPEVLVMRLWGGKLTLVHRRLWPAVVRIGRARAAWQVTDLTEAAVQLLARIERESTARSDHIPRGFPAGPRGFRSALRDLDHRLLILTRSVHTSTGAHALEARSWVAWSAEARTPRFAGSVASAQLVLEKAASRLSPGIDPRRLFPWRQSQATAPVSKR